MAGFSTAKTPPRVFIRPRCKCLDRVTEEFWTCCFKNGQRRGIRFETSTLAIEDEDSVEGAIEDGLEFAFRRMQGGGGSALFTASQKQEAGMKSDRHGKCEENERKQHGR